MAICEILLTERKRQNIGIGLTIFHFIYSMFGITFIIGAMHIKVYLSQYIELLQDHNTKEYVSLLASTGVILAVFHGISAWYCRSMMNPYFRERYQLTLLPFAVVWIVINLFLFCVALASFGQRGSLWLSVEAGLERLLPLYKDNPDAKLLIDKIQMHYKCCGIKSYTEWFDFRWYQDAYVGVTAQNGTSVPFSCCSTEFPHTCPDEYVPDLFRSPDTPVVVHPFHQKGCLPAITNNIMWWHIGPFARMAIIIVFIELIPLVVYRYYQTSIYLATIWGDPLQPAQGYGLVLCEGIAYDAVEPVPPSRGKVDPNLPDYTEPDPGKHQKLFPCCGKPSSTSPQTRSTKQPNLFSCCARPSNTSTKSRSFYSKTSLEGFSNQSSHTRMEEGYGGHPEIEDDDGAGYGGGFGTGYVECKEYAGNTVDEACGGGGGSKGRSNVRKEKKEQKKRDKEQKKREKERQKQQKKEERARKKEEKKEQKKREKEQQKWENKEKNMLKKEEKEEKDSTKKSKDTDKKEQKKKEKEEKNELKKKEKEMKKTNKKSKDMNKKEQKKTEKEEKNELKKKEKEIKKTEKKSKDMDKKKYSDKKENSKSKSKDKSEKKKNIKKRSKSKDKSGKIDGPKKKNTKSKSERSPSKRDKKEKTKTKSKSRSPSENKTKSNKPKKPVIKKPKKAHIKTKPKKQEKKKTNKPKQTKKSKKAEVGKTQKI